MQGRLGLRRAAREDLDRIDGWSAALHASEGGGPAPAARRAAIAALIASPELGALYVLEEDGAPAGFAAVAYGFSIVFGGRDGFLDEIVIDGARRGRGLGTAFIGMVKADLAAAGLKALHLEVGRDNAGARRLYGRLGFAFRAHYHLMSAPL